jgi:hypothetical protein
MKKDKSVQAVVIATFYLVIYILFLSFDATLRIAFFLFSLSPVLIIWMTMRILKHGRESKRTFDNFFYEDVDF